MLAAWPSTLSVFGLLPGVITRHTSAFFRVESGNIGWKGGDWHDGSVPIPPAVTFTAAMFTLAAEAHVLAGGSLPEPAIFAGLVALVLALVMILAKIRITSPVMAGLLGAGELVLHEAFNSLSVTEAFAPAAGGHLHGTGPVPPLAAALMPEHAAAPGALMLVLHAAATLATALVLARGEAAVWALAAWLRPFVRILRAVAFRSGRTFRPRTSPSLPPGGEASGCPPCAGRRVFSPLSERHLTLHR